MFSSNVDFLWVLQFPLSFQPLVMSQWRRTQGGLEMILFLSFFLYFTSPHCSRRKGLPVRNRESHLGAWGTRHFSPSLCGKPTCILICSQKGPVWRDKRIKGSGKGYRSRCWRCCRYSRFPLLMCASVRASQASHFHQSQSVLC